MSDSWSDESHLVIPNQESILIVLDRVLWLEISNLAHILKNPTISVQRKMIRSLPNGLWMRHCESMGSCEKDKTQLACETMQKREVIGGDFLLRVNFDNR